MDVNRQPPVFSQPAYVERLVEEQSPGTVLASYSATDKETPIASIVIHPPSPYFDIDNVTGNIPLYCYLIHMTSTHDSFFIFSLMKIVFMFVSICF